MRLAAKRDANEREIVDALEAAGVHVWRHLPVDLLAFRLGRFYVLEVKEAHARPRKDQAAQREFLELTHCPVVRNAEQALKAVGAMKP